MLSTPPLMSGMRYCKNHECYTLVPPEVRRQTGGTRTATNRYKDGNDSLMSTIRNRFEGIETKQAYSNMNGHTRMAHSMFFGRGTGTPRPDFLPGG